MRKMLVKEPFDFTTKNLENIGMFDADVYHGPDEEDNFNKKVNVKKVLEQGDFTVISHCDLSQNNVAFYFYNHIEEIMIKVSAYSYVFADEEDDMSDLFKNGCTAHIFSDDDNNTYIIIGENINCNKSVNIGYNKTDAVFICTKDYQLFMMVDPSSLFGAVALYKPDFDNAVEKFLKKLNTAFPDLTYSPYDVNLLFYWSILNKNKKTLSNRFDEVSDFQCGTCIDGSLTDRNGICYQVAGNEIYDVNEFYPFLYDLTVNYPIMYKSGRVRMHLPDKDYLDRFGDNIQDDNVNYRPV